MSFILDALKKSEADRQQNGATEFAGVPTRATPAAVPRWLWVVGALLVINLAVLIGLLLRNNAPPTRLPNPELLSRETTNSDLGNFEDQVAVAQQNSPVRQAASDPVSSRSVAAPTLDTPTSEFVTPNLISQDRASVDPKSLYPTIHEVRAKGTSDIPELHLDIHVFSTEPEGRFVFINMSKHREGDVLDANIRLKEITPDGVVLNHAGQLFLLPRE